MQRISSFGNRLLVLVAIVRVSMFVRLGVAMLATSPTARLTAVAWIPIQTFHLGEFGMQCRI
jgi:hypothetical protein